MWTIRDVTDDDVETLLALIHSAFEEYCGRLDPPSGAHAETRESLLRKLTGAKAFLAMAGPEPAGCVFWETEAEAVYFSRLAVAPKFRRRGLGRTLIDRVENYCRSLKRSRVRLGVRLALTRQRAYYERLGYRPVETKAHAGHAEPTYVIMEKVVG